MRRKFKKNSVASTPNVQSSVRQWKKKNIAQCVWWWMLEISLSRFLIFKLRMFVQICSRGKKLCVFINNNTANSNIGADLLTSCNLSFFSICETGKVDPTPHTSSFNMGYLVSPYPYPNGAGGPIPVSMVSVCHFIVSRVVLHVPRENSSRTELSVRTRFRKSSSALSLYIIGDLRKISWVTIEIW